MEGPMILLSDKGVVLSTFTMLRKVRLRGAAYPMGKGLPGMAKEIRVTSSHLPAALKSSWASYLSCSNHFLIEVSF